MQALSSICQSELEIERIWCIYKPGNRPQLCLKEHYSPIAHRSLNRIVSNFGTNKNYFLWSVGDVWNLNFKFRPIDLYGESEESGRLWVSCRDVNSFSIVIFRVNKDLSFMVYHYESIISISIETVPDPLIFYCNVLLHRGKSVV